MGRILSHLRAALCSSAQLEKSIYAGLQSLPDSIICDGIFFNYYRRDIRSIQFLALATRKTARLKWNLIPIPEAIARQFKVSDNFRAQLFRDLSQCPLTEYVVTTCFRNIKSLILMRLHLDGLRLGAIGVFSHHANAFTSQHVELFESVRAELSLLAFISLSRHNLLLNNTPPPMPGLSEEQEQFVVSPSNAPLYHLYASLNQLANSERPILLSGEEGVGKKTFAAALQQRASNRSGYYGIIDSAGQQLVMMKNGALDRIIVIDFSQPPNIALFLPLHQGSLQINEIRLLPECWQTFLLGLSSNYREYCQMQVIAIQTQSFSLSQINPGYENHDTTPYYLSSQRYANVFCQVIILPPLRYRYDDIPLLLTHYLGRLACRHKHTSLPVLGNNTLRLLWQYNWPGNITELITQLENALLRGNCNELNMLLPGALNTNAIAPLHEAVRQHIQLALQQSQGKISGKGGAAGILGVNSNTLYSKIKKLGIVVKEKS